MARQRTFFHKCHRCIYRGQAADWQPPAEMTAMLNLLPAEAPARVGVVEVDLVAKRAKTPKKASKGKAAAAEPVPAQVQL